MNNGTSCDKMLEYVKQLLVVIPRSHAKRDKVWNIDRSSTCGGLQQYPTDSYRFAQLPESRPLYLGTFQMEGHIPKKNKKSFISIMTDRHLRKPRLQMLNHIHPFTHAYTSMDYG